MSCRFVVFCSSWLVFSLACLSPNEDFHFHIAGPYLRGAKPEQNTFARAACQRSNQTGAACCRLHATSLTFRPEISLLHTPSEKQNNRSGSILIFGATGMVRQGVLRECLFDPNVQLVETVGRTITSYSEMMRSDHSTRETKTAGLPNFAFQFARSLSETPRAREQAPQAKTGMCLATIFSRNSLSGGQPIGSTASEVALRIR